MIELKSVLKVEGYTGYKNISLTFKVGQVETDEVEKIIQDLSTMQHQIDKAIEDIVYHRPR